MKTLLLPFLLLASCATDTGNVQKDQAGRVTNAVLAVGAKAIGAFAMSTISNAVAQQAGGKNVNWNAAASQGLWSAAPTLLSSDDVNNVISAWAGPAAPVITKAVAPALATATTPAQVQAVAVAAANGLDQTTK